MRSHCVEFADTFYRLFYFSEHLCCPLRLVIGLVAIQLPMYCSTYCRFKQKEQPKGRSINSPSIPSLPLLLIPAQPPP